MKLLFFDLETTGIKYWRNGVHQISGEIVIDGVTKESFNFNVCPHPQCEIEEFATCPRNRYKLILPCERCTLNS